MKKIISILLTATMLCSTVVTVFAADTPNKSYPQKFYDVPKDHWAFGYIAELVDRGVLAGYEDGSFKPEGTVSRAEFAKIMVGAAGVQTNDNSVYFSDMQNHWAIPYVNAAKDYLTAYADNTYRPNQAAVREDVTMAMVKLKGYDVSSADFSYLADFADNNSISNNVKKYVAVAVEKDLISGFEDNTFRGQATLTRAEAATLLWRAFQYGSDNKVVDNNTSSLPVVSQPITPITQPTQVEPAQTTPTQTQTTQPIATAEPTPVATEKPYKIDTLVKANVDSNLMTFDENGKVYYVENNKIYSVDTNKQKEEIVDVDSLAIEKDFDKQSFELEDICYDLYSRKLYIVGKYSGEPRKLYILNNKSLEESDGYAEHLLIILEDGKYVGTIWADGVPRTTSFIQPEGAILSKDAVISIVETDNNLIYATADGIYEYDWNTSTKIADSTSHVGVSKTGYVISKNNEFIIRSFNGNETRINKDDYKISDKSAFDTTNVFGELFLTPNNNIIFYDSSAKAFRMISEN